MGRIRLATTASLFLLLAACDDDSSTTKFPPAPDLAVAQDMAATVPEMAVPPPDLALPLPDMPKVPVNLQLLDISDWHGQLDPLTVGGQDIGGAGVLCGYFRQDRVTNPNTLTFTAGDSFGASPPLSNFFDDVPAVKALNIMGIDADTFGNHDFDRGIAKLQALIDMAQYKYVSANLDKLADNLGKVDSPFHMFNVAGVNVAVIGITNPDAPTLTAMGSLGTLTVTDPVAAATSAAAKARMAGAHVVVVLVHMGALAKDMNGNYSGPLIDFAKAAQGIDVIFGDHTNLAVNTTLNGALVVENLSFGQSYARVSLTVDPNGAGKITQSKVEIIKPYRCQQVPMDGGVPDGGFQCMPAVTACPEAEMMLAPYRTQLTAIFDTKIGTAADVFNRGNNVERLGEVPIGDLVADAVRLRYMTKIAIVSSGGLRAPLPSSYKPADMTLRRTTMGYAMGPPYDLVVGDAFAVLPFGNLVVTRNVTGQQLWKILERSVGQLPLPFGGFLQISGFKITANITKAAGMRVQSVMLDDGTMIPNDPNFMISVATSDFTNNGGDGYVELGGDPQGTTREKMFDVLLGYIKQLGAIDPKMYPLDRIKLVVM